jgi:hypothetical protein
MTARMDLASCTGGRRREGSSEGTRETFGAAGAAGAMGI